MNNAEELAKEWAMNAPSDPEGCANFTIEFIKRIQADALASAPAPLTAASAVQGAIEALERIRDHPRWPDHMSEVIAVMRAITSEAADKLRTQPSAVPGWQDISTAPRDGTKIILARFGFTTDTTGLEIDGKEWRERIFDWKATTIYSLWWACTGSWSDKYKNWNDGVDPCGLNKPTHWQPIPAPPKHEVKP